VSGPLDYRSAGVDIDAAEHSKDRIKAHVLSTLTAGSRGEFGGFGGMFRVPTDVPKPVLVSSADGVGTKLKLAIDAGIHHTVGHDLVNHCVNDILVQGAVPLFFLDYVAFGALEPAIVEAVVSGVAAGCRENGAALLGGETAEMPGLYTPPDYDLAGFIVGYVDEDAVLGPHRVCAGDVLIGVESSGMHTNGFSLARRILSERMKLGVHDTLPGDTRTVGEVFLAVHQSYLAALRPVLSKVHAMAHITGGGIPGNLSRALPPTVDAVVNTATWKIPNLFQQLQRAGEVEHLEMFRTFNMGVGMVVIADAADATVVVESARSQGINAWRVGDIQHGTGQVILN
jgi:phosphoribosylformylglycinamidine cyclo-ligase